MDLITDFEQRFVLGVAAMDATQFSLRVPTCVNSFQTGSPCTQRPWTAHWRPT